MASIMADNSTNKPSSSISQTDTRKGKRKLTIEPITNAKKKQITFSNRRIGLFNKADELSSICEAKVAVITFSNTGKMFSFGNPNPDDVVRRYINDNQDRINLGSCPNPENRIKTDPNFEILLKKSIDDMNLDALENYKASLEELRNEVISKFNHSPIDVDNQNLGDQVIEDHDVIKDGNADISTKSEFNATNLDNDDEFFKQQLFESDIHFFDNDFFVDSYIPPSSVADLGFED